MIHPNDFLKVLFTTFDQSAVEDFRRFLAANPLVKKWQIAADFCLHDPERPNNVFAFSIIPYDDYIDALKAKIRVALPKDLKKTRDIENTVAKFLLDPRLFHFAFVLPESPKVFTNTPDSDPLSVARESIAMTVNLITKRGGSPERVKRLNKLKQQAQAKNFNIELLADLYVLSYFLCFVSLLIARERSVEMLSWFSDRDNMTTWCDGVLWDIGQESLYGAADEFGIVIPPHMPMVALPTQGAGKGSMWYDELIRLPDYVAGILAAWDFDANGVPGDKAKYLQLAQNVVAPASNMAVLKVQVDNFVRCGRLIFKRSEDSTISRGC